MKKLLLFLIPALLLIPLTSALQVTDITFIPDRNHLSKNSPFILIVDFDDNQSVRVEWAVSEGLFELYKYGGIPKVKGRFICLFSTDIKNNCGPPIFTEADQYNLQIIAVNDQMEVVTVNSSDPKLGRIKVGGIVITSKIKTDNQTLHITSVPVGTIVNWMKYKVYDEDFNLVKEGTFEVDEFDRYLKNISLQSGEYYLSIYTESSSDRGGYVTPITVGKVSGEGAAYDIEATDIGLTGFNSILIKKGETFRKGNYRLINKKNETISNISVTVPPQYADYISIELQNDSIRAGRSIYFTFELHGIQSAMEIRTVAKVLSNSIQVGEINIKADVGVEGKASSVQMVEITSPIWTGDYLVGETSRVFTVKNKADASAENITVTYSGSVKNIIDDVKYPLSIPAGASEKINVTLSPTSAGRKTGVITISTDNGNAYIFIDVNFFDDISSDISGLRTEFENLKDQLSAPQTADYSSIISEITGSLSNSDTFFSSGNYVSAERELEKARTVLEILKAITGTAPAAHYCGDGKCGADEKENGSSECIKDCGVDCDDDGVKESWSCGTPPQPPAGDMTGIILILLLIVVAAVGIWFYFTKIRSSEWEEEIEEGY
jgi:hypothetical protein